MMVATPLSCLVTAIALAGHVSASGFNRDLALRTFTFPDAVPLSKRQTSGAQYQCHADCGGTINGAEDGDHCDSDSWRELLDACLACVEEYPIWQWYGDGVSEAAAVCNLTAEPGAPASPAEGDDGEETPEPSPQPSSESSTEPEPEPSSEPEPEPTSDATTPTSSEDTGVSAVPTRASNETLPEPSHVLVGAGGRLTGAGAMIGLGAVAAILVL